MTPGVVGLVLLAAIMHASWNAMLRGGQERFWTACFMGFAAGVGGLIAVFLVPLPARASWFCIGLSAAVHIVYQLLLVRMYRHGDFGHTYPVARGSSPLLIAIGGLMFASEHLRPAVAIGVVLICAGIFMLAWGGAGHFKYVGAALATGVSIAIYSVTDGLGVRQSGNTVSYTAWMMIGSGLPMPLVFKLLTRGQPTRFFRGPARSILQVTAGGLLSLIGYGIVIWAMEHAPMGPVSALRETSVLFAVLLGCVLLKEPLTWRKALSSLLIVSGAICLNLQA